MKRILRRISLMCLLISAPAMAQVSIDDIVYAIVDNNPSLQAQRKLIEAQRADDSDANSLSNPSVEFARVWGRHGIGNKLQLDVSQEFEWPGVYRLRSQAAATGVSAAELMVISDELDIAMQAKLQLLQLVYVRRQIALLEDLRTQIQSLGKVIAASEKSQEITVIDSRKVTIETYKLECQITSLKSQEASLMGNLQQMCPGVDLDLKIVEDYPAEPVLSREQYLDQVKLDPYLSSQRFTAQQEAINAKVAAQKRMPNITVGYQHQAEMGDRFNGFTVGMTLPFFEGRKAKKAALVRQEAAEMNALSAEAQKIAQVNSTLDQMQIWRDEIDAYRGALGNGDYMQLIRKAYEGGELSVLEFITEMQYYQEATINHIECEYNYQQALAELNKYKFVR